MATIFYDDLRLKAKRANQRMVELEHRGLNTAAYRSVQAILEQSGKRAGESRGRRFSETGKVESKSEYHRLSVILDEFLAQQTSTVTGQKRYINTLYNTADMNSDGALSKSGIDRDTFLSIFENWTDRKSERMYGSEQVIQIVQVLERKGKIGEGEGQYTIKDFMQSVQSSKSLKDLQSMYGVSNKDIRQLDKLGVLYEVE